MTPLNQLMEILDSRDYVQSCYRRADEAVRTFEIDQTVITDWDGFRYCMAKFRWHLDYHLLNMTRQIGFGLEFQWARAVGVLIAMYGTNGEKTAFEITRTGNEGGLYALLRKMATYQTMRYQRNKTSALVSDFWNNLSADQKIEAGREYIVRYRRLIPSELAEASGARILSQLTKVLEKHAEMIHDLRVNNRL